MQVNAQLRNLYGPLLAIISTTRCVHANHPRALQPGRANTLPHYARRTLYTQMISMHSPDGTPAGFSAARAADQYGEVSERPSLPRTVHMPYAPVQERRLACIVCWVDWQCFSSRWQVVRSEVILW